MPHSQKRPQCRVVKKISNRFHREVIFAGVALKLSPTFLRFQSTSILAILNNKGQEIVSVPKINIVLNPYFWNSTDAKTTAVSSIQAI